MPPGSEDAMTFPDRRVLPLAAAFGMGAGNGQKDAF
jgi:hypothetical protein